MGRPETDPQFRYRRAADQDAKRPVRRPVVVVGGGPVGLTVALDLAGHGVPVVVLNRAGAVSEGSRAICFAKRTLEIWDRLGCAEAMLAKGVMWQIGKVFRGDKLLYRFDLLPESGHKMPAFINLQQYHVERCLLDRAAAFAQLDIRWRHEAVAGEQRGDHVWLSVATPEGPYEMECAWLIAADGTRSSVRRWLGLDFAGRVFEDRFLIADVMMRAGFPAERWFWFDPPFHPGRSALLHMQADDVWRIDLQLGGDADAEEERRPERVIPRLRRMLGPEIPFKLEWVSVYTFQCRRLERFRHGRVLFAGDAAHQVSPFGARGANSGVQDADNLAWKLALVIAGRAPPALLDSYDAERIPAADENIRQSTRSTDFITPKGAASSAFRDAVLDLAERFPFARRLVNSGRLSTPASYPESPLNTADCEPFAAPAAPGTPCPDAPITIGGEPGWLLERLGGRFTCLHFCADDQRGAEDLAGLAADAVPIDTLVVGRDVEDGAGLLAERYDGRPGTTYLIRPDQHVAARFRRPNAGRIAAARDRAIALRPKEMCR